MKKAGSDSAQCCPKLGEETYCGQRPDTRGEMAFFLGHEVQEYGSPALDGRQTGKYNHKTHLLCNRQQEREKIPEKKRV